MDTKHDIQQAIKAFKGEELFDAGMNLFATLGYDTSRQNRLDRTSYQCFHDNFVEGNDNLPDIKKFEHKALVDDWKRIELLFQLTESEMGTQNTLFDAARVDNTIIEAYLFFAIELKQTEYTRTALSDITRQFNRAFPMPVMLLFKYGSSLTFSIINRRLHKRDVSKDVLEKVTLIKDIRIGAPHRAYIEILSDLSFEKLLHKHKFSNFVELHNAWQQTLDTKELNKQFYQRLFDWYVWALDEVKFPQIRPESDMIDDRVHQSESLIRLLTRLLFVWFMKEKGVISELLFDQRFLQTILKNFQGQDGEETIYYNAILQNLFFATLNQPIAKRKVINAGFNPREYGDPLVYRYAELFRNPDALLRYFEQIPFLNGGLFECLDQKKDADHPEEIRFDGFSSKLKKQPVFPDKCFFGQYANIDLSAAYGVRKKKTVTVTGLIELLQHYKFTIEENTPVEEEIALDPELLGKVFENLLASYNPETQSTARKQTGSFYTPREIVDYMVDESLLVYLKQYVDDETRLRALLAYTDDPPHLTDAERGALMTAIETCKVLDPACGSGAFPMGMLQKMIHLLRGIDPDNTRWFETVIRNFPAYMRAEVRKRLEKENWNYVRKLGIIQQCIYGVDIQPIATQIAKLRFFISLLVEQRVMPDESNWGLEPLPNLDFKIVTANSLIAAPASDVPDTDLFAQQADPFFSKFEELTGQYFTASEPADKKRLKHKIDALLKKRIDNNIRQIEQNFKTALDSRYNSTKSRKHEALIAGKEREITLWRSYLNLFKHDAVGFFEPCYFFSNVADGFDIVIGNPPYGAKFDADEKKLFKQLFKHQDYQLDSYLLFTEKAFDLAKSKGVISFIIPNPWLTNLKLKKIRRFITNEQTIVNITHYHKSVFEATVDTEVVFFCKQPVQQHHVNIVVHEKGDNIWVNSVSQDKWKRLDGEPINIFIDENIDRIISKLQQDSSQLGKVCKVVSGLTPYRIGRGNPKQTKEMTETKIYDASYEVDDTYRTLLRGKDIEKYVIKWDGTRWIKYGDNLAEPRYSANFDATEKIVIRQTGDCLIATLDTKQFVCLKNMHVITQKNQEFALKYILALLNSKLLNFYYQTLNPEKGEALAEVKKENVEKLIIHHADEGEQRVFEILVEYILFLKQHTFQDVTDKLMPVYFEQIIDGMAYELYLGDRLQQSQKDILQYLQELPPLTETMSDTEKLAITRRIFTTLYDKHHPVRNHLFYMDSIEEIRIIKGKV